MILFSLNGNSYEFDGDDNTPLLWVIRVSAGLTGTKYGCGTYPRIHKTIHRAAELNRKGA